MHFYTLSYGPNSKAIIYNEKEVRVLVSIQGRSIYIDDKYIVGKSEL